MLPSNRSSTHALWNLARRLAPPRINAAQHAREWIALTTALYTLTSLLSSYSAHPAFLDSFEFFFSPLANPDGYEYTWSGDRYWRKNMRGGYGVDMNRNWPYYWGYDWGSSDARYSETYRGPKPLSEPETQALYNAIMSLPRRFALIDFHSFGQLILRVGSKRADAPTELARSCGCEVALL